MDNYKLEVLKNGIKVITVQDPKAQLIYFKLSLNIGSDVEAYKDKSIEIAHFLEHIFATFTSKKYPSALKNNELFAKLGVYVNASVTEKMSTYILKIPPDNFLKVIDIIYNSILNFKVDEAIFKQEKHAIKEELNDILNDTWINLEEDVNKILYPNHPRSVGEKDRIKMVKAASPSELTNFFKKYYRTNNMCLGIYGNVTNELRKSITEKLSKLNETCAINYNKYLYTNSNLKTNTIHFTKCPNAESYNLIIIFRIEHLYFSLEQDIAEGILNILTSDLESILTTTLPLSALIPTSLIPFPFLIKYIARPTPTAQTQQHTTTPTIMMIITVMLILTSTRSSSSSVSTSPPIFSIALFLSLLVSLLCRATTLSSEGVVSAVADVVVSASMLSIL